MRLRVAVVAPCPFPSSQGTQVFLQGMCRALLAAGVDLTLFTYDFGEELPDSGLPIRRIRGFAHDHRLRAGPSTAKLRLDLELATLLDAASADYDLIHTHNVEGPFVAALARRRRRRPVLFHLHNLMRDELATYARGALGRRVAHAAAPVLDWLAPKMADRIAVLSESARDRLRSLGVKEDVLDLLPPGADPDDLEPGWQPGIRPTVVYAGNPDGYQGLPTLWRAMALVRRVRPEVTLRLVSGAPWTEHDPALWAAGLGGAVERHTVVGWAPVRELVRTAHVAVVPRPASAGFPMKLLNTLGLGVPTVCAAGSAMVGRDGIELLTSIDGDSDSLAGAILRLLDPPLAGPMSVAARHLVRAEHTWARRVPAILQAYQRTLAAGRGRR